MVPFRNSEALIRLQELEEDQAVEDLSVEDQAVVDLSVEVPAVEDSSVEEDHMEVDMVVELVDLFLSVTDVEVARLGLQMDNASSPR